MNSRIPYYVIPRLDRGIPSQIILEFLIEIPRKGWGMTQGLGNSKFILGILDFILGILDFCSLLGWISLARKFYKGYALNH